MALLGLFNDLEEAKLVFPWKLSILSITNFFFLQETSFPS